MILIRVCSRWIPQFFTWEPMQMRVQNCKAMLEQYQRDPTFLIHVII